MPDQPVTLDMSKSVPLTDAERGVKLDMSTSVPLTQSEIQGLPPGAIVGPPFHKSTPQVEGLPEGAIVGPAFDAPTQSYKPVKLDMSTSVPLDAKGAPVTLDMSKSVPVDSTQSYEDIMRGKAGQAPEKPGVVDRTLQGVKQSVEGNIVAPIRGALTPADPATDAKEVVVNAVGGQAGVAAYRLAKTLTSAVESHFKAPSEHFENAKQDLVRALTEFHRGDYRNALSSTGNVVADTQGMMFNPVADRIRELSEGSRPGGNLATPLAKDVTDAATMALGEKAPGIVGKVGKVAEKVAPESMNALLRANKETNYLYGKNPGKAFLDEGIKIPRNSLSMAGQLENLHGQLETAGDNLTNQVNDALSEPTVAGKQLDIVPTVKSAIADAKKYISKQTGLDVPKYISELNNLEDSILTRYDSEGNPIGKVASTKISPAEVADVKRSIGKNTQWKVLPTDPELKLKSYMNGIRKQLYGKLADIVETAAPDSDIKTLNGRLANIIEAQGLLEKRIALEHGTGGYNAALRKGEFWGGLATALFSPEPITKVLGASAVADRVIRSVPGKIATAKALAGTGEALQSPVTQAAAQAAARSAQGAVVQNTQNDWALFRSSDGNAYRVHPEDLSEVQRRDPQGKVIQ